MTEMTVMTAAGLAEGARGAQRLELLDSAHALLVQPRRDGRWEVIRPGAPRASAVVNSRSDAVDRAQGLANAGRVSTVYVREASSTLTRTRGDSTESCDPTCVYCCGPETD